MISINGMLNLYKTQIEYENRIYPLSIKPGT